MRKPLCSGLPSYFFPVFVQVCPWWFPSPWLHVYLRPQISLMSCCIVLFVSSGVSPACFCLLALFSLSLSLYTFLFVFRQVTKLWLNMDYFPFIQICLGIFILATILLQTKLSLSLFKVQVTYNLDL